MSDEKKKAGFWWPDVSTLEQAKAAAVGGAMVACLVAMVTLGVTLYGIYDQPVLGITAWAFVDVVLFAIIALGIWRLSRAAAVAGLTLYLIEQFYMWATTGPKAPVMVILFTLFLFHAVRGTFAYHKLSMSALESGRAGESQETI